MANPFGELVDDEQLEGMSRYFGKPKTQEDRAREALRVQTGVAHEEARRYLDGLKEFHGSGTSTLCMIYNATGETLYYVDDHDWYGYLGRTPYPTQIGNGQWVSFLHDHTTRGTSGSEAAVIYRGKQKDGFTRDFVLSWSTPYGPWNKNKAYCEMSPPGKSASWDGLYDRTNNSDYNNKVDRDGMIVKVSTATGSSPVFNALLTIPELSGPKLIMHGFRTKDGD
ncbi:hypothetical protein RND81_10G030100 [Saponaria officinalis]|uniref:23 kDa jasmonate-induced protein-like n=1 Tax=Saponaria officinalis TaxID=3572 RepID=A0AAW1I018_SAPOF